GQARTTVKHETRQETRTWEEIVDLVDIAVGKHILPRHKDLIEDDNRVIFIQATGQWVVKRAPHRPGGHFIRRTAEEFHARRIGRDDADESKVLRLNRKRAIVSDEVVV